MMTVGKKILIVLVLLLAPAFVFAVGEPEDQAKPVSEGDVLKMIKANQVDVVGTLAETCGACHGGETEYPVAGAVLSFEHSGHALGWDKVDANSWYANGNGCQQCHTNEGFIEYLNTGEVVDYVDYPSQPGCFTCHDPHTTGDFSLRTTDAVMLNAGLKYDFGSGNLCANCHQSRSAVADAVKAGTLSSRLGPHHGPEADLFLGVNGAEVPGRSYTSSIHTFAIEDSCVTCHLALPEGRYSLSPEVGGHSFYAKGEVHEATKINAAACSSCHEDVGQDGEFFNIAAKADFDADGTVENLQAEVEGLLHLIVNNKGTGVLQKISPAPFGADGSWIAGRTEFGIDVAAAVWNYRYIEEDRSLGIHNPRYAVQLLMDTINHFDSSFSLANRP